MRRNYLAIIVTRANEGWNSTCDRSNGKRVYTHTATWNVQTTDGELDAEILVSDELLTEIGTVHPENVAARLQSYSVNFESNARVWKAVATYTTDRTKAAERPYYPYTPAIWSGGSEDREIVVEKDRDGKAFKNSAGDLPNPPEVIKVPYSWEAVTVTLSYDDFRALNGESYKKCVNSSTFRGWSAGKAMMDDFAWQEKIVFDEDTEEEYKVVDCSIRFLYDRDKFNPIKVMSRGFNELNDDDEKQRILLPNGEPITDPVPLDEDGKALFGDYDPLDIHYEEYNVFYSADFGDFDFE